MGPRASLALRRRSLLAAGVLAAAGCTQRELDAIDGGFAGIAHERGHLLRAPWPTRAPDVERRVHTLIAAASPGTRTSPCWSWKTPPAATAAAAR